MSIFGINYADPKQPDRAVDLHLAERPVSTTYIYKSLKWLSGIELTAAEVPGYWETRGYDVDGTVGNSNGRDDEPTS